MCWGKPPKSQLEKNEICTMKLIFPGWGRTAQQLIKEGLQTKITILPKLKGAVTYTGLGAEGGSARQSCHGSGRTANIAQRLASLFTAQAHA